MFLYFVFDAFFFIIFILNILNEISKMFFNHSPLQAAIFTRNQNIVKLLLSQPTININQKDILKLKIFYTIFFHAFLSHLNIIYIYFI